MFDHPGDFALDLCLPEPDAHWSCGTTGGQGQAVLQQAGAAGAVQALAL